MSGSIATQSLRYLSSAVRTSSSFLGADCAQFGGTRLYIPLKTRECNAIVQALGLEIAGKLSRAFSPAAIRIPLARVDRAIYYRNRGLSNPQIARKLGITENAVSRLFSRMRD